MIEMTDDKIIFENPQHDFPTRVTYWRAGDDGLNARIEGKRNGQPAQENWKYKRSVGE